MDNNTACKQAALQIEAALRRLERAETYLFGTEVSISREIKTVREALKKCREGQKC